MPIAYVYYDEDTEKRLIVIERETGRAVDDLASSALAEAALNYFRGRPMKDDPGHRPRAALSKERVDG